MSAPKVGDRVRVTAGQWTGWEGYVLHRFDDGVHLWVDLRRDGDPNGYMRSLRRDEVELVATEPVKAPRSAEQGSDVREWRRGCTCVGGPHGGYTCPRCSGRGRQ